ncbi:sulfotransferase family 2 domain-containing protein [Crocosphaera subtropica]|nr:sulfotransferase family 2 domain-containing protein [Crocosphaera subtropica]
MVLVSHKHKFIYMKTRKTAGTSVEIFFEPFCRPPKQEAHFTDLIISDVGIVGARGGNPNTKDWFNHIPAYLVKEKLGLSKWDTYFKFCVIRNPWDKMVSTYWYNKNKNNKLPDFKTWLFNWYFKYVPKRNVQDWIQSFPRKTSYITWLKKSPLIPQSTNIIDRNIYTINNKLALNYYIRFENLSDGIEEVCQKLNLPCDLQKLGNYKASYRQKQRHYSEYYDQETMNIVSKIFAKEIQEFSYQFGD